MRPALEFPSKFSSIVNDEKFMACTQKFVHTTRTEGKQAKMEHCRNFLSILGTFESLLRGTLSVGLCVPNISVQKLTQKISAQNMTQISAENMEAHISTQVLEEFSAQK